VQPVVHDTIVKQVEVRDFCSFSEWNTL